ncbi:MAG: hypothetical protein JXR86_02025 [Spirochaetales bacterium]|nr:hypothetical protein [Spirochaetales bacterium]
MKTYKIVIVLLSLYLLVSCQSAENPESRQGAGAEELDGLIMDMTDRIIPLLPLDKEANIAVYYFTVDGEQSPYSDYLINNLTTGIANRAPENCHIVSRKGLDRIMEEYSFQLSDLVSEETQVDIGELLGADTIITGYITPLEDGSNINVQLIDVHSGAVTGGFTMNIDPDIQLGQASDRTTMGRRYVTRAGEATSTIILENFDGPISEISPGFFEEHWGEDIISLNGETDVDPEGFAYLNFSAEIETEDFMKIRENSDMTFYLDLPLNNPPEENDGVYIKIKPDGFTRCYIMVRQEIYDEPVVMGVPVNLRPGQWNEMRIPFGNLRLLEGDDIFDREENISITLGIPYFENVLQGYLKGLAPRGTLAIDEIGLYALKTRSDKSGLITGFEDEILKAVPSLHSEGGLFYRDYSRSDSGIEKINRGIDSARLEWEIAESGPFGSFLSINGTYELNDEILTFIDDEGELSLVLDLFFEKRPDDFETLSFLISAEGLSSGYVHIFNPEEEDAFDADIRTGRSWSRIEIDFADLLYSEENSGFSWEDPVLMRMIWPITPAVIKSSLGNGGVLNLTLNLDELNWE